MIEENCYKYFESDKWNLSDGCYIIQGLDPEDKRDTRYNKRAADIQSHFFDTVRLYKKHITDFCFEKKDNKYIVCPEYFIEWAYSEGFIFGGCQISEDGQLVNPLRGFAEERLDRDLTRYEFGRYEQFYVKWFNKGYWTSNEAINLLCNKDPASDIFCGGDSNSGIPAINGGYNNDDFEGIGEDMLRDTASGKLKKLEQKIPQQAYDSYDPQVILKWGKARGLNIPIGFLKSNNGHFYTWFNELIRKTPDLQIKREELVSMYNDEFKGQQEKEYLTTKTDNFISAWKELAPKSWSKPGRRSKNLN